MFRFDGLLQRRTCGCPLFRLACTSALAASVMVALLRRRNARAPADSDRELGGFAAARACDNKRCLGSVGWSTGCVTMTECSGCPQCSYTWQRMLAVAPAAASAEALAGRPRAAAESTTMLAYTGHAIGGPVASARSNTSSWFAPARPSADEKPGENGAVPSAREATTTTETTTSSSNTRQPYSLLPPDQSCASYQLADVLSEDECFGDAVQHNRVGLGDKQTIGKPTWDGMSFYGCVYNIEADLVMFNDQSPNPSYTSTQQQNICLGVATTTTSSTFTITSSSTLSSSETRSSTSPTSSTSETTTTRTSRTLTSISEISVTSISETSSTSATSISETSSTATSRTLTSTATSRTLTGTSTTSISETSSTVTSTGTTITGTTSTSESSITATTVSNTHQPYSLLPPDQSCASYQLADVLSEDECFGDAVQHNRVGLGDKQTIGKPTWDGMSFYGCVYNIEADLVMFNDQSPNPSYTSTQQQNICLGVATTTTSSTFTITSSSTLSSSETRSSTSPTSSTSETTTTRTSRTLTSISEISVTSISETSSTSATSISETSSTATSRTLTGTSTSSTSATSISETSSTSATSISETSSTSATSISDTSSTATSRTLTGTSTTSISHTSSTATSRTLTGTSTTSISETSSTVNHDLTWLGMDQSTSSAGVTSIEVMILFGLVLAGGIAMWVFAVTIITRYQRRKRAATTAPTDLLSHSGQPGALRISAQACDADPGTAGGPVSPPLPPRVGTAPAGTRGQPSASLEGAIREAFGSMGEFKARFEAQCARGGSAWAWLVVTADSRLAITSTLSQENPFVDGAEEDIPGAPILACSVWDHASGLEQFQCQHQAYMQAWWRVVNWETVSTLYDEALNSKAPTTEGNLVGDTTVECTHMPPIGSAPLHRPVAIPDIW
ncbi:unnamed protein product [Prorocentrum cordatum]|uniref:Manganese/iron superoxide dismutase C-terminal domain-containing protein n=1 Tax=Prorocentrum cordatum TaxID=2364126 RepID=A0ABN9P7S9_9DINO|nr:unnamed protein product [Polarella glacialis]